METHEQKLLSEPTRRCKRKLDCSKCLQFIDTPINYHNMPRGQHYTRTLNTKNVIIFVVKGQLMVNSSEYNGLIVTEGNFILHAMGAEMETLALTHVECVTICFADPRYLCETSFIECMDNMAQPLTYQPLVMNKVITNFLEGFKCYIDSEKEMLCNKFYQVKCLELAYILSSYYTSNELIQFFHPIIYHRNRFCDFVMKNHERFQSIEELAQWGGYKLDIFLTLFKNIFKESAEEWKSRNKLDFHAKKKITHEQTSQ